jgi:predicted nuclease of predicted toxin-antitoxin system
LRLDELPLFADQNMQKPVVDWMRSVGWDVVAARDEQMATAPDPLVLARAHELGRVLLTHDTDFGELVVRRRLPHSGIVLIRGQRSPNREIELFQWLANYEFGQPPFLASISGRLPDVRVRSRSSNTAEQR